MVFIGTIDFLKPHGALRFARPEKAILKKKEPRNGH
jgi:hypothetical protein